MGHPTHFLCYCFTYILIHQPLRVYITLYKSTTSRIYPKRPKTRKRTLHLQFPWILMTKSFIYEITVSISNYKRHSYRVSLHMNMICIVFVYRYTVSVVVYDVTLYYVVWHFCIWRPSLFTWDHNYVYDVTIFRIMENNSVYASAGLKHRLQVIQQRDFDQLGGERRARG